MDFVYYNPNPKNLHTVDCVVRALTAFLNMSWRNAFLDIINWCADRGRVNFNYRSSYNEYLKEKGYERHKKPRKNVSVGEFVEYFAEYGKVYIVSMPRHLTLVINRRLCDIWDCSSKKMDGYWVRDVSPEDRIKIDNN